MSLTFPSAPIYARPIEEDQVTGKETFSPLWIQWFLDVANYFTTVTAAGGGAPGGSGSQIQVNVGGVFSGFSSFTYVGGIFTVANILTADITGKLSFYGGTTRAQAAAYVQTYSTAARTVPNATFSALSTTASTNIAPYGFSTSAQADAIAAKVNALGTDVIALKQLINSLINDLSATLGVSLNAT